MNYFHDFFRNLLASEDPNQVHFNVVDPTAAGNDGIRSITLVNVAPSDGSTTSDICLYWTESQDKLFEKKYEEVEEAANTFDLIKKDLEQASQLTKENKLDEAKGIIQALLKQYSAITDTIVDGDPQPITTTMASKKTAADLSDAHSKVVIVDNSVFIPEPLVGKVFDVIEEADEKTPIRIEFNDSSFAGIKGQSGSTDDPGMLSDFVVALKAANVPIVFGKDVDFNSIDWNDVVTTIPKKEAMPRSPDFGDKDVLTSTIANMPAYDYVLSMAKRVWKTEGKPLTAERLLEAMKQDAGAVEIDLNDATELLDAVKTRLFASNTFKNMTKVGKVVTQNFFFSTVDEAVEFQKKMKELQPEQSPATNLDAVPGEEGDDEMPTDDDDENLADSSVSYEDFEKQKDDHNKNLNKRIEKEVKEQVESALEQKVASTFDKSDDELIKVMRKGKGRTWEEIREYYLKNLKYDKDSVAAFIDAKKAEEDGTSPTEDTKEPTGPTPVPEELTPPETHEKLLDEVDDKKDDGEIEKKESLEIERHEEIRRVADDHVGFGVEKIAFDTDEMEKDLETLIREKARDFSVQGKKMSPQEIAKDIAYDLIENNTDRNMVRYIDAFIGNEYDLQLFVEDVLTPEEDITSSLKKKALVPPTIDAPNKEMQDPLAQPNSPEMAPGVGDSPAPELDLDDSFLPEPQDLELAEGTQVYVRGNPETNEEGFSGTFLSEFEKTGDPWVSVERTDSHEVVDVPKYLITEASVHVKRELSAIKAELAKLSSTADLSIEAATAYICPKCKKPSAYADHLGWRDCENCGWKEGPQPMNLKEASSENFSKDAPKGYTCDSCGGNLRKGHYKKMPGVNGYICDKCEPSKKKASEDFTDDIVGDYLCPICQVRRKTPEKLGAHLRTFHSYDHAYAQDIVDTVVSRLPKKNASEEEDTCEVCGGTSSCTTCRRCKKHCKCKKATKKVAEEPINWSVYNKKRPKDVDRSKAVPATNQMQKAYEKFSTAKHNLDTIKDLIKEARDKYEAEKKRIYEESGQMQNQRVLDAAVEKLAKLISATETRLVSFGEEMGVFLETEEKIPVEWSADEKLERIYKKFPETEAYIQKALNGAQKLAETVTNEQLVIFPSDPSSRKLSQLKVKANVSDVLSDIYTNLLKAFQALSLDALEA